MTSEADFEQLRPLLLGVAYRMLGSMWDAEDVLQDAYLRWLKSDRTDIAMPRAFLITIVTRLSLDVLKSSRVKREAYVGPWLPEPVETHSLGPMETATMRDTVSYATMHLLERLTPPERAVFILRECFELPYEEIAPTVGASVANCRQMHHRANARMVHPLKRFTATPQTRSRLVTEFLAAAQSGNLSALAALLSQDVVAYNDGGGKVRAALRPVSGSDNVMSFIAGLVNRYSFGPAEIVNINGELAISTSIGGGRQYVMLDIVDDQVEQIFVVLNPEKLGHAMPVA